MNLELALWLFAACGAGITSAFAFAWAAHRKAENLKDELNTYKLHVAESFASNIYMSAVEQRTVKALDEIKSAMERQDVKLDRLVARVAT